MLNSNVIKNLRFFFFVDFFHGTSIHISWEHQYSAEHSVGNAVDVLGVHEPNIRTKRHSSISYSIPPTLYHVPDRYRLSLLECFVWGPSIPILRY